MCNWKDPGFRVAAMNTIKLALPCARSFGSLAVAFGLGVSPLLHANLSTSGSVTDPDGNSWTNGAGLHVGHSGFGSVLFDDHLDGNAITSLQCANLWIGWGDGSQGAFTVRGSGTSQTFGNIYIAEGVNSRGTFTQAGGAVRVDPDYKNYYIYVGRGVGSYGKMIVTDPGTSLRLADWLLVGHLTGAQGRLQVENGAVCDSSRLFVGYQAGATGEAFVSGAGSTLKTWLNERTGVGWSGRGYLTISDGGLAQLRFLEVGYANGAYGEVLVTGAGSRLEAVNGSPNIGRGGWADPPPGEGLVRLARGGVFDSASGLNVGYSTYNPKGTLVFTVGDNGSGTITPGRADINGMVSLGVADLLMEVDAGIVLPLGQQFVLVDYLTLRTSYDRFQNTPEGGILVTPNHHAFRINYATDLGFGDLGITATVVAPPTTDDDSDGMLDAWEIRCFGAIDHPEAEPGLDSDGDGRSNADEHTAGTDPLDPTSCFTVEITTQPGSDLRDLVYSPYDPAVTYAVERATSLLGPWTEIATTPNIEGASIRFTLPTDTSDRAFYHITLER